MHFSQRVRKALEAIHRRRESALLRYSAPFVLFLIALLLQAAIMALAGRTRDIPYTLFYLLAIFISAWWGGFGPGITASVLVMVGFPLAVARHFGTGSDWVRLLFVVAISVAISAVAQSQRRGKEA